MLENIIKIVRPVLAAVSINLLSKDLFWVKVSSTVFFVDMVFVKL